MAKSINYEENRIVIRVKIPRLKEICPKTKCYFKDGTFFMIYNNRGDTYPSIVEVDGDLTITLRKQLVKCYLSAQDSRDLIENILFPNIGNRESFARLVEELSELHDTTEKKIEDVEIEYDKIEAIYEKYKQILKPADDLYLFCYYWAVLCIVLDFRVKDGKDTFIGRSLMVKDAAAYIRGQITREEFGKAWDSIKKRLDPTKTIINMKYVSVEKHKKKLKSERFVNKKDEEILVRRHGRIRINTA